MGNTVNAEAGDVVTGSAEETGRARVSQCGVRGSATRDQVCICPVNLWKNKYMPKR